MKSLTLMRSIVVFIALILAAQSVAQESANTKYWIIFKDKNGYAPGDQISESSEQYAEAKNQISDKALKRRMKVLASDKLIEYADLPVNQDYIDKIEDTGIKILAISKWLNGVSAYMTSEQLSTVKSMDFVSEVDIVQKLFRQRFPTEEVFTDESLHDYGNSLKQMEIVNVLKAHELGVTGKGVLIGCFDDGFDWRNHESLRRLNVVGEYDFINEDGNTYFERNQDYEDRKNQGAHGTAVLSTMSGYKEGKLVSPAYDSDIMLAKTEYVPTETPMEEDFWLEAAEWAEAQGVDIITSSLIYKEYDSPFGTNSYKYNDYDGRTAITTFAASRCARLGVVVCQAMGNYFQTQTPSLGSAADADSIISVGAVTPDGNPANFTSNGPTSDGRTKPDVSAPGVMVYAAVVKEVSGNDSTYEYTSGTSFATPITAGICALILSAHPHLTPLEVRDALRNTASKSGNPDNVLGWGIVNAYDALLYHGVTWSNEADFSISPEGIKASSRVDSKTPIMEGSVKFNYSTDGGKTYESIIMEADGPADENNCGKYVAHLRGVNNAEGLTYFITAKDNSGKEYSSNIASGR